MNVDIKIIIIIFDIIFDGIVYISLLLEDFNYYRKRVFKLILVYRFINKFFFSMIFYYLMNLIGSEI